MFVFQSLQSPEDLGLLRDEFYQSLTAPLDGMLDERIHEQSALWGIAREEELIGYFSLENRNRLLHFFLLPGYLNDRQAVFHQILETYRPVGALVSTNNPVLLCACLEAGLAGSVDAYLFENYHDVELPMPALVAGAQLRKASAQAKSKLIRFYEANTAASSPWLENFVSRLTENAGLFYLSAGREILGVCEVRKSLNQPHIADLGVIVGQAHRRLGIGVYLLQHAKEMSYMRGLNPLCSCEAGNIASRRMIEKAGFVCKNLVLRFSLVPR